MRINIKKVAGSIGAVVLGLGGLIAAGKAGFCENLGKPADDQAPETPDTAAPAEPVTAEEVKEEKTEPDGKE